MTHPLGKFAHLSHDPDPKGADSGSRMFWNTVLICQPATDRKIASSH